MKCGKHILASPRVGNQVPFAIGSHQPPGTRSAWPLWILNILLPGVGVVLTGSIVSGLTVGLLVTAALNFIIWGLWLTPASTAAWMIGVAVAGAAGGFAAAQVQLAQALRLRDGQAAASRRRKLLAEICGHIERGAYEAAAPLAVDLAKDDGHDLHAAFRVAQVLTRVGWADSARSACQRLRVLDIHHVYRRELQQFEQTLSGGSGGVTHEE